MSCAAPWYHDRGNVVDLLRWLADTWPLTVEMAIAVVEKPWNYEIEYEEMVSEREVALIEGSIT